MTEPRNPSWQNDSAETGETSRIAQMNKVFGYLKGLHATHLMDLGRRLGLFEKLAASGSGITVGALAEKAGLQAEYTRVWCESACALELLDYSPNDGYRLAPFMDELLADTKATYYLGGFPSLHLIMARDYALYPALFRNGKTHPYQEHDQEFLEAVATALGTLPRIFIDAVLPKLPKLEASLASGARILDVGCGGGHAIVEFARRYPGVRCVGIDLEPNSVRLAGELIVASGLSDRVEVRLIEAGSWPEDLGGSFDLVTTFLVLHEIEPGLKDTVIANCVEALKPGGQLLVFDERYPTGPAELRDPTQIYAVMAQWYETTWGNVVNTGGEIHDLLERQQLTVTGETSLSRFYIVTAQKA
jgi:SAM-dependent methyltransferase